MFNIVEFKLIKSIGTDENWLEDKNDCSVSGEILLTSLQGIKTRLDALHLALTELIFHTYLGQRNEKIQFI